MVKHFLIILLLPLLLLNSCDLIEYHPYYVDIDGPIHLTQRNVALIERQCAGKDTIRFAHVSDTQRWYDETEDIVKSINAIDNLDFVIHTGDQTDFGLSKEYEWMRTILMRLKVPYVCAIGNHDCIGTGEAAFSLMYGPDNFSFNASFLHVVSLNTNAYEYDYSDDVPNFAFITNDVKHVPDTVTTTVIAMHVGPFMYQFNDNVAEYFNFKTTQYPDLKFCICGHDHRFRIYYPFDDKGPAYYECAAAKSKSYILYTVTRESYTYEVVQL